MALPNVHVLGTSVFVYLSIYAAGMLAGTVNGILEMQGFQLTFPELYGGGGGGESPEGNYSDPNNTDQSGRNLTCSSGNGARSDFLIGMIVALYSINQVVGFLISGWMADFFSRKYSLIIGALLLALGCALLASSFFTWMLYMSRFFHGIATGILYMMCPLYTAEASPKEVRGMMTSITGPSFNAGLVTAIFTNVGFSRFSVGWRIAVVVVMVVALVFSVGMKFLPHTPRWLVKKGREKEALFVLAKVNRHSKKETLVDTYLELEDIKDSVRSTYSVDRWLLVKKMYRLKYRLFLVTVLFMLGATSGLFILLYSTTTFCVVGVPPFTAAVALGFILLVGGIVPTLLADKVGRKPILIFFSIVNVIAGTTAGVLTQLYGSSQNNTVAYTVVFLICVYAFGYSASWLSVPWIIASECFPNDVRGLTFGVSCVSYGLFGFVLNQLTPVIIGSPLQLHGFLYLVSMETLLAGLFVFFAVPETKAVSLESMDTIFSQSCWDNVKQFLRCTLARGEASQQDVQVDLQVEIKLADLEIKQQDSVL